MILTRLLPSGNSDGFSRELGQHGKVIGPQGMSHGKLGF